MATLKLKPKKEAKEIEIVFAKEDLFPFWDEAQEHLFPLHYMEVGPAKLGIKLNPDTEIYKKLFADGKLEVHTVRDRDTGFLLGYSVWIVGPALHYKDSITALNDIIFLHPAVRKGLIGYKFIKYSLNKIKKTKAERIMFHVKPHVNFGPLIERLGGREMETIYVVDNK